MDFSKASRIVWQTNVGKTFQFSPASPAMFLLQPIKVTDGIANSNDFNLRDFAEDFDVVVRHVNIIHCVSGGVFQFAS